MIRFGNSDVGECVGDWGTYGCNRRASGALLYLLSSCSLPGSSLLSPFRPSAWPSSSPSPPLQVVLAVAVLMVSLRCPAARLLAVLTPASRSIRDSFGNPLCAVDLKLGRPSSSSLSPPKLPANAGNAVVLTVSLRRCHTKSSPCAYASPQHPASPAYSRSMSPTPSAL